MRRRRTDARVLGGFWRGLRKPTGRSGEEERNASALGVVSSTSLSLDFCAFIAGGDVYCVGPVASDVEACFFRGPRQSGILFTCLTSQEGETDGQMGRFDLVGISRPLLFVLG